MNNRKVYLPQRFTIFALLSEIREIPIKRKMINAALSFELSENQPVEKIIVSLLKRAYNPRQLIINHQSKLLSLASYMTSLKRYLISQQVYADQNRTSSTSLLFKPSNQEIDIVQSTCKHKCFFKEVPQQDIDSKDTLLQSATLGSIVLSRLGMATALTGLGLFAYGAYNTWQTANSGSLLLPNNLTFN